MSSPWYIPPCGYHLCVVIPFFPPTSNHIYGSRRGQPGRFKTKEAELFERRFIQEVVPNYILGISSLPRGEATTYEVHFVFYFPLDEVITKSFRNPKGKAQSWYKRMDSTNRIKLIEDCLVKALDIDDSLFFDTHIAKRVPPAGCDPQVHIFILAKTDPTYVGFPPVESHG